MQNTFEAIGFYFEDLDTKPNHKSILFEIDFPHTRNLSTKTKAYKKCLKSHLQVRVPKK